VNAAAPGAFAEHQPVGPTWDPASPALPASPQRSLPPAARLRAAFTGLGLAALALSAATAAGPSHTALGILA